MNYSFSLNGRGYLVNAEEHATGPRYKVEGTVYDPKVTAIGKGHYKVTLEGKTYEFTVRNGVVTEGPRTLDLEVRRDRPQLERAGKSGRKGDGKVKPPMPGKIVEVRVKVGQDVAEGDVLVVLEAMKMQNDLKSPIAGKVAKVHVAEGANVEATTVLIELTAAPTA